MEKELLEHLRNILNHYNGGEDTIVFDGDTYYIFQMEG